MPSNQPASAEVEKIKQILIIYNQFLKELDKLKLESEDIIKQELEQDRQKKMADVIQKIQTI